MFSQYEPNEVLRLSPDAATPLWLTKKLYTKIDRDEELARRISELASDVIVDQIETPKFILNYFQ
jgi:hypothetical protein